MVFVPICERSLRRTNTRTPHPCPATSLPPKPRRQASSVPLRGTALARRRREGRVVHHSDQGSQYTSLAFGERCRESGIAKSMGSAGDAYDNAMCEIFFATLECELIWKRSFPTTDEARREIFRLHRRLEQHAPAPLGPRLQVAGQPRAEPCGLKRTRSARGRRPPERG